MPKSSDTRSELHEGAREWASLGFFVFPIKAGVKYPPAIDEWQNLATDNLDIIDKWWSDNPGYNIGVVPGRSGMFVVDQDGPVGAQSLARLEGSNQALPSTLTVQTPTGPDRLHRWFLGQARSTVSTVLGPKLDTRGKSVDGKYGYVLVPPSRTADGEYRYIGDTNEIAEAPTWLTALLGSQSARKAEAPVTLDEPSNIARATDYLRATGPAIEGQGGDNRTYQVVCGLHDFGLAPATTLKLLLNIYNPRCEPPWTKEELETKISRAWEYAQNEAGAYQAEPPLEAFSHYAVPQARESEKRKRFYPLDEAEMAMLPEPTWLLRDLIQAKSLCLMVGQYESYKSFLALDIALTLASGIEGWECQPRSPVPVVYAPSEGMHAIARNRKPSWKIAHKLEEQIPFYLVEGVPWVKLDQDVRDFIDGIQSRGIKPKLIVIDTVASAMLGLKEDEVGMGMIVQFALTLKSVFGCTVLAVHHLGKDKTAGSRGSTALPAGFDTVLTVEAQQITRTVRVTVDKQKDGEKRKKPYCFQGEVVGPSLVFTPIDQKQYKAMNAKDETLGHYAVAGALRTLGALSEAAAVTTRVLATQMCPQVDSDTAETHDRAVRGFSRELQALAKGELAAFVTGEGRDVRWYIPAQDDPPNDEV